MGAKAAARPPDDIKQLPVETRLSIVREARSTFGSASAKVLWLHLGLPHHEDIVRDSRSRKVWPEVARFIEAEVEFDTSSELAALDAYQAFCNWSAAHGLAKVSLTAFGRSMRAAGVKARKGLGTFYQGIRLRPRLDPKEADIPEPPS